MLTPSRPDVSASQFPLNGQPVRQVAMPHDYSQHYTQHHGNQQHHAQNQHGSQPAPQYPGSAQSFTSMSTASSVTASGNRAEPPRDSNPVPADSVGRGEGQNYNYRLEIIQQPDRARMCGFGDKDRRPITPPPFVKLTVYDKETGRMMVPNELNYQSYVLMTDLYDENAANAVNLIRHASNAPNVSISMATTTSYPPPPDQTQHAVAMMTPTYGHYGYPPHAPYANGYHSHFYPPYAGGQPPPAQHQALPPASNLLSSPSTVAGASPSPQALQHAHAASVPQGYYPNTAQPSPPQSNGPSGAPANGMFTRNLIGSLAVSATVLNDLDNQPGLWFILQDLSVRQEGRFRIRCAFTDVGGDVPGGLTEGSARVLVRCYSEPFTVYSAKKFPGVQASTPLSTCLAGQGVKLPIRKENVPNGPGRSGASTHGSRSRRDSESSDGSNGNGSPGGRGTKRRNDMD